MAIRNTVSIEFSVGGPGLQQLAAIENRLRNLGSASGGINTATANLGRLGSVGATAAAGVSRTTQAVHNLGTASTRAGGALRRIGEIVAGTFGGNVLAGIFTGAASAAANFAKESVGAALSMEQALVVIKTQSRLTGTDLQANIELAKRLAKEFKVSETAGLGLAAGATRFASAAGRPGDTEAFLRSVADLAAAAGRPMSELNEIVRQIASGDVGAEAALDKILGGKNPSVVYDEFAKSIHRTADSLTTLEKKQALLNAVLVEGAKVQGVAAESMNSTTGRVSALSAAYENIQTRLGTLIVSTPIFQRALEGLEKAAAALDSPEAQAGFLKMSKLLETITRGAVIAGAEITAFGEYLTLLWRVSLTKASRFLEELTLRFKKAGNDIVIGLADSFESLPGPIKAAIGFGAGSSELAKRAKIDAQVSNASIISTLATNKGLNHALDIDAIAEVQRIASTVAKTAADFDARTNNAAVAAAQARTAVAAGTTPAVSGPLAALANVLNAGAVAGVGSVDFRKVPVAVINGDSITTEFKLERIAKRQEAAGDRIVAGLDGLVNVMEEAQKNPAFARVEFVAGDSTLIKSVVSTGGAIP